ncbi:hypothetical protein RSAG8_12880, partial [Rhizoctonia solani AG-8 WAC10335]
MIYPALRRGARPSLPRVEDIRKVSAHQLRAWLRTYFNYHYIWQGGTHSVPWKVLSRETKFKYIAEACFPRGVKALLSPSDMPRSQLELWYCWLIDGQDGRLRSDQIFHFLQIDCRADSPLQYPEAIVDMPSKKSTMKGISHMNDAKGSAKVSHAESEVESADDVANDLSIVQHKSKRAITYHVTHMGAHQEVHLLLHAPDEAAPSSTVHLTEHANPQLQDTLLQLLDSAESEFFVPSFEADFADPLVTE